MGEFIRVMFRSTTFATLYICRVQAFCAGTHQVSKADRDIHIFTESLVDTQNAIKLLVRRLLSTWKAQTCCGLRLILFCSITNCLAAEANRSNGHLFTQRSNARLALMEVRVLCMQKIVESCNSGWRREHRRRLYFQSYWFACGGITSDPVEFLRISVHVRLMLWTTEIHRLPYLFTATPL